MKVVIWLGQTPIVIIHISKDSFFYHAPTYTQQNPQNLASQLTQNPPLPPASGEAE